MTKIIIELEIEGDVDDAFHVVDKVLDAGVFQDAINEYEHGGDSVVVTSAVSRGADE